MAERSLPREAGQNHQPDADDGVDADEHQLAYQIAGEHERRDRQPHQQTAVGPEISAVRKQFDVVFIIGLEHEAHASDLLAHVQAEQAFGFYQQYHQQHDVGGDVLPALREVEAGHALDYADQ